MKKIIIGIVILACIGALAFPLYVRHKRHTCVNFRSPRSHCMSNLSQLGMAIHMYAMDHDGHCPPTLGSLSPEYWPSLSRFFCPNARRDGKVGRYVYFQPQGRLADIAKDTPIAADYPDNHAAGGNVLRADESVTWIDKDFAAVVSSNLPAGFTFADNNLKWYQWEPNDL